MKKIVLIGGGGHAEVIIDIIKSSGEYEIIGVTEKRDVFKSVLDIPVIGNDDALQDIYNSGVEYAFICIGSIDDIGWRNTLYRKAYKMGSKFPVLIHKSAIVSPYSVIGDGTCIMAGGIINPGVNIGRNCIINTGAILEHDCKIGDNVQISTGARLAGNVKVGSDSFIGMGSSVIQGISIGRNVIVGAGAVVISNISDNSIVAGVPAKLIKSET